MSELSKPVKQYGHEQKLDKTYKNLKNTNQKYSGHTALSEVARSRPRPMAKLLSAFDHVRTVKGVKIVKNLPLLGADS
jgi:hypothetical protein